LVMNISNSAPGTTLYWYISPSVVPIGTYKIKVTSVRNATVTDISDATFDIVITTPGGSILVTAPDGGEEWSLETTQRITWTKSASVTEDVRVDLLDASDNLVMNIANSVPGTYLDWFISSGVIAGGSYKVKVTSVRNSAITDQSNNIFYIDYFDLVTYPNPAVSTLTLDFNKFKKGKYAVEMYNHYGLKAFSKTINTEYTNEFALSVANLPNDIYIITVKSDKIQVTKRIIIQH
ncbi:MAG: T9SS type A sorting domain-containing protein, partial [Lentimicrobiaceae bacterium]|nr:T9SS type A sorting domain-containing protein [Lentimicrobiaceae bacterium]